MTKFKNHHNSAEFQKNHELNCSPSLTVPDQSLSISEIMRRYAQGLPLEGQRVPLYEGEDDFMPDTKHMDLAEIEELKNHAKSEIDAIQERQKKNAAAVKQHAQKTNQGTDDELVNNPALELLDTKLVKQKNTNYT